MGTERPRDRAHSVDRSGGRRGLWHVVKVAPADFAGGSICGGVLCHVVRVIATRECVPASALPAADVASQIAPLVCVRIRGLRRDRLLAVGQTLSSLERRRRASSPGGLDKRPFYGLPGSGCR